MVVRGALVVAHRRVPFSYFLFLVFFGPFFLYRVFLPFAIFGRILRTLLMSFSLQAYMSNPPMRLGLGAGTFFMATYLLSTETYSPSFSAACRIENALIQDIVLDRSASVKHFFSRGRDERPHLQKPSVGHPMKIGSGR